MEVRLRDLLLDLEDRIHQGTLGTLKVGSTLPVTVRFFFALDAADVFVFLVPVVKVMDRQVWRSALEAGNYKLLCSDENNRINGPVEAMEVDCGQLRARDRWSNHLTGSPCVFLF